MYKYVNNIITVAAALLLQGCLLLNSVEPLQEGQPPFFSRATVVYGVDVNAEGRWRITDVHPKYRTFGISLDEYDIEKQNITGNCWRYNQANAFGVIIKQMHWLQLMRQCLNTLRLMYRQVITFMVHLIRQQASNP